MEGILNFEKLMEIPLMCLTVTRAHPELPRNKIWYLRFIITNLAYQFYLCPLFYTLMVIEDYKANITDTCAIVSYIVVSFVISFHLFVLIRYHSTFKTTISDVRKGYEAAKALPPHEKDIVIQYALEGRRVTLYWFMVCVMATLSFTIWPLVRMVFYYLSGSFKYVPILPITYPDYFTTLYEGVGFWIGFAYWVSFVIISAAVYMGAVPLGPIFLLYSCGQLELLRGRMMKLFPSDGSITFEERTEMLRGIAIELQAVYDFVDRLKTCLKVQYELTLKGTALIIPFTAYVMTESLAQKELRLEFINLFFAAIVICSIPCYYGDKLIEKSSELQLAVYSCGWEIVYEKRTRSTLLILMTRMQQTVAIRSVFLTVNLETLGGVFKQAYGLYNFLRTIWG